MRRAIIYILLLAVLTLAQAPSLLPQFPAERMLNAQVRSSQCHPDIRLVTDRGVMYMVDTQLHILHSSNIPEAQVLDTGDGMLWIEWMNGTVTLTDLNGKSLWTLHVSNEWVALDYDADGNLQFITPDGYGLSQQLDLATGTVGDPMPRGEHGEVHC